MKISKSKLWILTIALTALGLSAFGAQKTYAAISASMSCSPTTINTGASSSCTLSAVASDEDDIAGAELKVSVNENLSLGAITVPSTWTPMINSGGELALMANSTISNTSVVIATFSVTAGTTAGTTGTVTASNFKFTNSKYSEVSPSPATASISITSPAPETPAPIPTPTTTPTPTPTSTPAPASTPATTPAARTTTPAKTSSPSAAKSSNTYLSSLKPVPGTIVFAKETLSYSIDVPYATTNVDIYATAEDSSSSVVVNGGKDILIGANTANVVVTAQSGDTRTYTITINRLSEGQDLSDNNFLAGLKVSGYTLKFNKLTTSYDLVIKKEKSLTIDATSEDLNASVTIFGNKDLKPGSKITITVISQSGKKKVYTINIKSNVLTTLLIVALSIIGVAVVAFGIILISKSAKSKKYIGPAIDIDASATIASDPNEFSTFQPATYTPPEDSAEPTEPVEDMMPVQPVIPADPAEPVENTVPQEVVPTIKPIETVAPENAPPIVNPQPATQQPDESVPPHTYF